jgi:hypothetical protein
VDTLPAQVAPEVAELVEAEQPAQTALQIPVVVEVVPESIVWLDLQEALV